MADTKPRATVTIKKQSLDRSSCGQGSVFFDLQNDTDASERLDGSDLWEMLAKIGVKNPTKLQILWDFLGSPRGIHSQRPFWIVSASLLRLTASFVSVTVLLPPDLVRDYCHFLESLAAFFESADRRIKIERAHQSATTQASQKESGERCRADYRARLCASFDTYLAAGLDRKEAFKRVAAH